jgi:hypothetical protein
MPFGPGRDRRFRMADWRDSQVRYLGHFSDGGSGLRYFDARLTEGETFSEGDIEYTVRRLDHTKSAAGMSHAWVEPCPNLAHPPT